MIYFDDAASAEMSKSALAVYIETAQNYYANPASSHAAGLAAEKILEDSRRVIADTISAQPSEIVFTSSGTESNNLAIFGSFPFRAVPPRRVIISNAEHDSVFVTANRLADLGFDVVFLPVTGGILDTAALQRALSPTTAIVSVMHTNNLTGAIFDIAKVAEIIRLHYKDNRSRPLLHTDAIQSYCKIPFSVKNCDADLISLSSHKIGGGKGSGAIYIRKGVHLTPMLFGGAQEFGIRSSTVNLPQIAAFAAAASEKFTAIHKNFSYVSSLRSYAEEKFINNSHGVFIINNYPHQSPFILSLTIRNVKSEVMLNFLSSNNIFISAGSACSAKKNAKDSQRVLASFGLSRNDADFTVRISLSEHVTYADIDSLFAHMSVAAQRYSVR